MIGNQDTKAFKNPNFLLHRGQFSVIITKGASMEDVPVDALIEGNKITVFNGEARQAWGGIQLRSMNHPFAWEYEEMVAILDGEENLLWINDNHR